MAKPRGKRRQRERECSTATLASQIDVERDIATVASEGAPSQAPSTTPMTSYIRELRGETEDPAPLPSGDASAAVTSAAQSAASESADLGTSGVQTTTAAETPSLATPATELVIPDEDALQRSDTIPSPPPDFDPDETATDDESVEEFERRIALRPVISNRTKLVVLTTIGVIASATALWKAFGHGSRSQARAQTHHVRAIASAASTMHSVLPASRMPAPAPSPVATAPSTTMPLPASDAATLESEAVPAQPTQALTDLLRAAVEARARGVNAATAAMQAWLDAGGTDARPVAQLAYWLGRRNEIELAEQWAERATRMDPNSQMAWYVLGATRLEDPRQRRSEAFEALRRCAALPGPYAIECRGPLTQSSTGPRRRP